MAENERIRARAPGSGRTSAQGGAGSRRDDRESEVRRGEGEVAQATGGGGTGERRRGDAAAGSEELGGARRGARRREPGGAKNGGGVGRGAGDSDPDRPAAGRGWAPAGPCGRRRGWGDGEPGGVVG
nr:paraneoplastic antigen Ma6E-like [Aegilops tauschii subsp. strangulata]